jgi:hypothetical protein
MPATPRPLRQTVTLPGPVARKVRAVAQASKTSTSKVIAALIETGLDAREREKREFLDLADQLARARAPEEQRRLKDELARRTFGD